MVGVRDWRYAIERALVARRRTADVLRASPDRRSSPEPRVNMTPMTPDSATISKTSSEAYNVNRRDPDDIVAGIPRIAKPIRRPIASFRLDLQGTGLRTRAFAVPILVFERPQTQGAGLPLIWAEFSRSEASVMMTEACLTLAPEPSASVGRRSSAEVPRTRRAGLPPRPSGT